jgi:hypothetical protein
MYDYLMIWLLIWLIAGPILGILIGQQKGRMGAGLLFGILLGPLGWLIVALGPNFHPKCSHCGGTIVEGASKCKNCGSSLIDASDSRITKTEYNQEKNYTISDIEKKHIKQTTENEQKDIIITRDNIVFTADEMKVIENKIDLLETNECVIIHSLSRIIKRVHKNDYNKESKWILIKEKTE